MATAPRAGDDPCLRAPRARFPRVPRGSSAGCVRATRSRPIAQTCLQFGDYLQRPTGSPPPTRQAPRPSPASLSESWRRDLTQAARPSRPADASLSKAACPALSFPIRTLRPRREIIVHDPRRADLARPAQSQQKLPQVLHGATRVRQAGWAAAPRRGTEARAAPCANPARLLELMYACGLARQRGRSTLQLADIDLRARRPPRARGKGSKEAARAGRPARPISAMADPTLARARPALVGNQ